MIRQYSRLRVADNSGARTLQCITVVQNPAGKPGLTFHPDLDRRVRELGIVGHHLTISDESSLACACVVLELAP